MHLQLTTNEDAIVQLRRYIDWNNLSSNFKLDACL